MATNNNYTIENLLGSGHFGKVYKAKKGGKTFAIKKVVNTERNTAQQEIKILKQVDHDKIIKYYDHFMENKVLCIVLEYADVGTMEKAVKNKEVRLEEYCIWRCTAEILKVGSAESTLLLFFCPCCANFWSVYAHRMCIGAYFGLQLC